MWSTCICTTVDTDPTANTHTDIHTALLGDLWNCQNQPTFPLTRESNDDTQCNLPTNTLCLRLLKTCYYMKTWHLSVKQGHSMSIQPNFRNFRSYNITFIKERLALIATKGQNDYMCNEFLLSNPLFCRQGSKCNFQLIFENLKMTF